jgi:hypothetical protein
VKLPRLITLSIVCTCCAGASFLATVWSAPPATASPATSQPTAFFRWLNVTLDQQHEIGLDDPVFEKDLETLRGDVQTQRSALAALLADPAAKEAHVLPQIDRLAEAEHRLQRRIGEYLLRIRDHLTQQQRLQLMDLCAATLQPPAGAAAAPMGRGQGGPGRGMGFGRGRGRGAMNTSTRPAATAAATPTVAPGGMQAHDAIEALFTNHEKITRSIEEIPGGIRASTTSSDPEVARQLRTHVGQMKTRLEAGMPMRRFDPLFRELFAHADKVRMTIDEIPGGVRVTETSDDPQVVLLLRQHARTVSEFAEQGFDRMPVPSTLPAGYRPTPTGLQPPHDGH